MRCVCRSEGVGEEVYKYMYSSFRPEIGWPLAAKELEPAEELRHTLRQSQHSVSKPFSPTDGN